MLRLVSLCLLPGSLGFQCRVVHGIFGHVGLSNKTYEPEQEYRRSADRIIDTKIDPASPIPLEKKKNMQNQRRRASVGSNREGMANGRLCASRPTLALRAQLGGQMRPEQFDTWLDGSARKEGLVPAPEECCRGGRSRSG